MHRFHLVVASVVCTALVGCGTTRAPLTYQPPTTVQKSTTGGQVTMGSFVDSRGEVDPTWAGAIRGGFGNSLKVLALDKPVADVVKAAFADGLKARGASTVASGQPRLTGVIRKFDCDQYIRREATIEIELSVIDVNGQTKFTRSFRSNNVDGSMLTLSTGVFASIDDLRVVMEKTLRETVDKALDDSSLRAALQL